jgi:hypothetical protein
MLIPGGAPVTQAGARLPSRHLQQPDILTPLEYPRGRTECPRSGDSRDDWFPGGPPRNSRRSDTRRGVCPARHEGTARAPVGEHTPHQDGSTPCDEARNSIR